MKPDLFSEIVLLGSGGLIFASPLLIVAIALPRVDRGNQLLVEDLCHQPFKSVPF